jgi:4-amino-4-deoxy-L-arabinose transferase-like glycosyltransferase
VEPVDRGVGEGIAARRPALLLAALGGFLYVAWLGARDLWYPGEPDLAQICRAMLESGDWIVPRRNGEIFLNYPPLHYWAGAVASGLLGGMSDFALRLPGALAAIGLVLATFAAGSRWFGAGVGLWAGLLLLASSQFTFQAIQYRPDMLFSLFAAGGILAYAHGAGAPARLAWRVAGFGLLGVAVLAKGPLGLLLPGLVLALWHASRRDWRRLAELVPLAGVTLAVALPWYVACARATGTETLLGELLGQNVGRFASGEEGHGRPPWYYLVSFWADFAPWSLLAPLALAWVARGRRWRDPRIALSLVWFVTFFAVLSLAATKRQAYLMPAYPAVALLLATWLDAVGREGAADDSPDPRPAWIYARGVSLVLLFVGAAAAPAAAALGPLVARLDLAASAGDPLLALRGPLLAAAAVGLATWRWVRRALCAHDLAGALLRAAFAQLALFGVVVAGVLPALDPANSYEPQGRWIEQRLGAETRIGFLGSDRKIGAFGYYSGALVERVGGAAEIGDFFRRHPASLVVVEAERAPDLFDPPRADWLRRVVREFDAARRHYLVLAGPDPAAGAPRSKIESELGSPTT